MELVKDQWIGNMKAKQLRTKMKIKPDKKGQNNSEGDSFKQAEELNSAKKSLKFFHMEIESEDVDEHRSVNIDNINSINQLHYYYQKIIQQYKSQVCLKELVNQINMQQYNKGQDQRGGEDL